MKGRGFAFRLGCALQGLRLAFREESSFRTQCLAALLALGSLPFLHPPLVWAALVVLLVALVLALELVNTALEHTLDGLHPGQARFVQGAKDCAAAAVLLLSGAAVVVYGLMLCAL